MWFPMKYALCRYIRSFQGFIPVPTEEENGQFRDTHQLKKDARSDCGQFVEVAMEKLTQKLPLESQSADSPAADAGDDAKQCLTTVDLVSLGMGSACGIGMYLTAGIIAGKMAGPGGVLSIVVGGIGSLMTGLHYAELAGLCPRTSGSSYFYTYVTIGELAAFLIGWGLMAEYIVCTAFAAVATSHAVNSVSGDFLETHVYEGMARLGIPRIDLIAALICISLTWLLAIGAKMSAKVNNALNLINMAVLVVFVTLSGYLGSFGNWRNTGFAPRGYEGILAATPIAYCAFIGFDAVSTTGKECKDPVKSIPTSIILSNIFNTIIFVIVVAGLTWDVPYTDIEEHTAMLDVFERLGVVWVKYVIAVGAVAGLVAASFGSMFPLPRILQNMARDGLLFRYFSKFCPKRQTALRATLFTGAITTILASLADVSLILELTLICTLFTYIIVVMATLVARFVPLRLEHNSEDASLEKPTGTEKVTRYSFSSKSRDLSPEDGVVTSCHERRPNSNTMLQDATASCLENNTIRAPEQIPNSGSKEDANYFDNKNTWLYIMEKKEDRDIDNPSLNCKNPTTNARDASIVNRSPSGSGKTNFENMTSNEKQSILLKDTRRFHTWRFASMCCKCLNLFQRHLTKCLLVLYIILFVLSYLVSRSHQHLKDHASVAVLATVILILVLFSTTVLITLLPPVENVKSHGFRTPVIPLISVLTAAFNIYLMVTLDGLTWLLFSLWMGLGLCVYLMYGTFQRGLCSMKQYEKMEGNEYMEQSLKPSDR